MSYCRSCGTKLPGPAPVQCARCGTWQWLNAKPCSCALVVDGGRLLFVRRGHEPWRDHWTVPGGFCDQTEHPIAAAERETVEEVGLTVEVTGYLGTWLSPYEDETIAVAYYHARPLDRVGEPDPAEIAEVSWFAPEDVPELLAPPDTMPAVVAAWLEALADAHTVTPLPDRPR